MIAIVTNRRLDNALSGSTALLRVFVDAARQHGLATRLYVASSSAFSNRPWGRVHKIFRGAGVVWPRTLKLGELYIATQPMVWLRFARRLGLALARAVGLRVRIDSNLSEIPNASELAGLAAAVRAGGARAVMVEYSSLGPLLAQLEDIPHRLLLMHDLFSARAARFRAAGAAPDHIEISLEEEASRCTSATAICHASLAERDIFAALLPNARHLWLKPTVRVRRDMVRTRAPFACFIGSDHAGNRDALRHLLSEIWPGVVAALPEARLVVAGRIGAIVRAGAENVETLGVVKDLGEFAGPDCIGVAPIRLGSGLPIKVAEYLSLGMPVATYRVGVEGFGSRLDGAVMAADTPAQFTEALVRLLQSEELRQSLSAAGLDCAEAFADDCGIDDELRLVAQSPPRA
jgi:hypothetical protein